ncbi:OLC1v1003826C5 [Oldenlandia corymbosa var. corymbosa]|uniref:OLC1v1003826C5 n=1 Tax=Oldenlandia corymbosa var. corymbosa TaxID=529605 RepID=A0AAV1DAW1_OLDCO|nr:OLC1v1003826C5 [Oldenlandia corymbosa var. corymbosa]
MSIFFREGFKYYISEYYCPMHLLILEAARASNPSNLLHRHIYFPTALKVNQPVHKKFTTICAVPETVASVVVAAAIAGAAATLLAKRTEDSAKTEVPTKICDDCAGSGICPECKGEGFVLKKLSDESAERARMMAKNAATRYTAGLPKKWSYCTKCSSSRSCRTCDGTGKLSL